MRRFLSVLMVLAGLIGAGPAFACAAAAAAGDCCPPDAPSGCTTVYEQIGVEQSIWCVAVASPARVVAAEGRHQGSPDPNVLPVSPAASLDVRPAGRVVALLFSSRLADASLTYLHTGRLRL